MNDSKLNLQNLARKIVKADFIGNPVLTKLTGLNFTGFNCIVSVNNRLRTTGAWTYFDYDDNHYHIELNKSYVQYPIVLIIGTLKHEICHYFLWNVKNKKGNTIRSHGKEFKTLLKSVHGIYVMPSCLKDYQPNKMLYCFQCGNCGVNAFSTDEDYSQNYVCGNCYNRFKLIGKLPMKYYLKNFLHNQFIKPQSKLPNNTAYLHKHIIEFATV